MTVSSLINKVVYSGNGSTTNFPITFPFIANSDNLGVYLTDLSNVITKLTESVYTYVAVDSKITYPNAGSPLATGYKLTIIREISPLQEVDLLNQGPFSAETIESMHDKNVMMIQEISEKVGRCIQYPVDSSPSAEDTTSYLESIQAARDAAQASAANSLGSANDSAASAAASLSSANDSAASAISAAAAANTATATNTASAIVARDASGNFSAGVITAALIGNATTATTATNVTTNANLTGPVISVGNATTIAASSITSSMIVDDTIVNADINSAAAIVKTKLATGTASRVEVTDASGLLVESTVTTTELGLLSGVAAPLVTTTGTQTLTNKTITGADFRTPVRSDFKQDTFANLTTYATTASNGQAVWATDTKAAYIVKDAALVSMGGGGISLSTIFQLDAVEQLADWSTGDNATFLGGGVLSGTFAKETVAPLNGTASYKYTQAAGSLNDYMASSTQAVPLRFRGQQVFLSFPYQYDGSTNDIQIVVYDVTNSTIISSSLDNLVATNGATQTAIVGVIIPTTCTSIRVGFHTKALNSGKILSFDDMQVGSGIGDFSSIVTNETSYIRFEGANNRGSTDTSIIKFNNLAVFSGNGLSYISTAANGVVVTALASGKLSAQATLYASSGAGSDFAITKNQTVLTAMPTTVSEKLTSATTSPSIQNSVSVEIDVVIGDKIRLAFSGSETITAATSNFTVSLTAQSSAIALPTQQVSSDTMNFAFKATAITDTDAIGTFNTYLKPNPFSGNSPTINATAPTQTIASMNIDGVRVYSAAHAAASTAALPSRFDIKIGKGLKAAQVDAFSLSGKANILNCDIFNNQSGAFFGVRRVYDSTTGILNIDAGSLSSNVTSQFIGINSTGSGVTDGYFVFNASTTPTITALPILAPRIAYLSDVKASGTAGGSSIVGTQTRTLNTIVDSTGIITSLVSNQFILGAGTYEIDATAPSYRSNRHRARIRNITDSTTSLLGDSNFSSANADYSATYSRVVGQITITSPKTFELQHYTQSVLSSNGLGVDASSGESEVYSQVKITKIR